MMNIIAGAQINFGRIQSNKQPTQNFTSMKYRWIDYIHDA